MHTQGEDMDDALANANEAVALYVEGLREDGESLDMGIVRRASGPDAGDQPTRMACALPQLPLYRRLRSSPE